MSDIRWIKLMLNTFDDEKIKIIESLPEGDTILIVWIKLLIQAGKVNDLGYIHLDGSPYTDDMISTLFRRPVNTIRYCIETLLKFKMIEVDIRGIYIVNFQKYQNIEGMEKIKDQWREASKKYRLKQKQISLNTPEVKLLKQPDASYDDHDGHNSSEKNEKINHIASDDNHMTDKTQSQEILNNHMTSYDRHAIELDKEYNTNDGQAHQIKSLVDFKEEIGKASNKVGYLAKIFQELHKSCPPEDKKGCYGRLGKMSKIYNNDYCYVLAAIVRSQDGIQTIDGSHLSFIEKMLQNKNNGNGNKPQETQNSRYEYVN